MIYSKIKELAQYKGYSNNLDRAIEFLVNLDKLKLLDGKTEIHNEQVFINVMEYETKIYEEGIFEAHKNYIDIQMLLEGEERILVAHIDDLKVENPYDEQKDIMFLQGVPRSECILANDYVCICFPEDAHMPGISMQKEGGTQAKKIVVKIRVEE